jgi:DNA-binding helix-hairpin-helix protein with protein kinase domain
MQANAIMAANIRPPRYAEEITSGINTAADNNRSNKGRTEDKLPYPIFPEHFQAMLQRTAIFRPHRMKEMRPNNA